MVIRGNAARKKLPSPAHPTEQWPVGSGIVGPPRREPTKALSPAMAFPDNRSKKHRHSSMAAPPAS